MLAQMPPSFQEIWDFAKMFFIVVPVLTIVFGTIVVIVIVRTVCKAGTVAERMTTVAMPSRFMPRPAVERTTTDGSDIRMVRIPERCPSCNAALSHEGIDWVGPLEARCSYCGATVRATLERL